MEQLSKAQLINKCRWFQKQNKYAWYMYFKSQEEEHIRIIAKIQIVEKTINIEEVPEMIKNELKEMYEIMKKQIECPICYDEIGAKDIGFSSCGHKYCNDCLKKLKEQRQPKCAICRKKIYVKK